VLAQDHADQEVLEVQAALAAAHELADQEEAEAETAEDALHLNVQSQNSNRR
jgi:hypothetical protein